MLAFQHRRIEALSYGQDMLCSPQPLLTLATLRAALLRQHLTASLRVAMLSGR